MTTPPGEQTARPVALVTGVRRGLGRSIAYSLAKVGFDLVLNDLHDDEDASETVAGTESLGARVKFIQHDLANIEKHSEFVSQAAGAFGRLDCLVNNTGVQVPRRIGNLSGGNQQKCVLAKLLNADCEVLLIDKPTRGVDIGAKREIYQVLADLADREGLAIIMVSSELPEIIGLCDRAIVMREGRITAELPRAELTEEKIMHAATD